MLCHVRRMSYTGDSMKSLPLAELNSCDTISQLHRHMGTPLFIKNVASTLCHACEHKQKLDNHFFENLRQSLSEPAEYKQDFTERKPLQLEGINDIEGWMKIIFQFSLSMNMGGVAYLILRCCAQQGIDSMLNAVNISLVIDLLSVHRSQSKNVQDIDRILELSDMTNYLFSSEQVKMIIDKAYMTLRPDLSFQLQEPFEIVSSNFLYPNATIENLIRVFGSVLTSKVSDTLSYYTGNEQEDKDIDITELLNRQLLSKYLQFCYHVIQERCMNNDPVIVYKIWLIIKPFHNKIYNAVINSETNDLSNNFYYYQTLAKMITTFSKNRRYRKLIDEIIYDLPLDSVKVCPELMTSIIYHCARTKNESLGTIVGSRYDSNSDLSKLFGQGGDLSILATGDKFTPAQARAFLAYNLRLGRKQKSLEIIEYLKDKLIGITNLDFNEVIRCMLYNGGNKTDQVKDKLDSVWKMIEHNNDLKNRKLNKYALITYLDYMINQMKRVSLDFKRIDQIYQYAIQCSPFEDVIYWNYFYMSYFKYIIRKYPLNIAQEIYKNCKIFTTRRNPSDVIYFCKVGDYGFRNNPFMQKFQDVRLKLNDNVRLLILRDIYQRNDSYLKRAKQLQSDDLPEAEKQYVEVTRWVYEELTEIRSSSMKSNRHLVQSSMLIDIIKTIHRQARSIGFQLTPVRDAIDANERVYRLKMGEAVAIDNIKLEEEFEENTACGDNIWRGSNALKYRK